MGNSTFCLILDFEAARLFVLRASSGILAQKHDQKYELSSFYVLLFFFDDFRNYRFWFMLLRHTKKCLFVATLFYYFFNGSSLTLYSICSLLRSAQISHGSLRPAYPGSPTCCTCGYSSSSFVLLICIETFLTPNTVQLMMYTTLNAPVCLSLSLFILSLLSSLIPRRSSGART